MAVSKKAAGTVVKNTQKGYSNFGGQPAPAMVNWFPNLTAGTFAGKTQAAWSITASSRYVVLGGEFPAVNGLAQQGLVRFAIRSSAPKKVGPQVTNGTSTPIVTQSAARTTRVSWTTNWDRDDTTLRYEVLRDGVTVARAVASNTFWNRRTLTVTDPVIPAVTYRYAIRATDPDGNVVTSPSVKVQTASSSAYPDLVRADGAEHHWRLGSPAGRPQSPDSLGGDDLTLPPSAKAGATGAVREDRDTAVTLVGDAATSATEISTRTTTVEGWFKLGQGRTGLVAALTSSAGASGSSTGPASVPATPATPTTGETSPDDAQTPRTQTPAPSGEETTSGPTLTRALYVDTTGRLRGGLAADQTVLTSPVSVTDGAWHHAALVVAADRVSLVLDGTVVDTTAPAAASTATDGHWIVGGAVPTDWPRAGTAGLSGTLDEVAVYPVALTVATLAAHAALRAP